MDLDYLVEGEIRVTMVNYLKNIIGDLTEEISTTSSTSDSDHLFVVHPNNERKLLYEERATAFHHEVAQLMFAVPWSRKDIQTAVTFLTMKMRSPEVDEWHKLRLLLKYLRGKIQTPLILRVNSLNVIKWWVNAS